jgi:hypothetical protein
MSGQNHKMNGPKKASAGETVHAKRKVWLEVRQTPDQNDKPISLSTGIVGKKRKNAN